MLQKEEKHYRKLQIKKYTKVQLSNYAQSLTKTVIVLIEIIKTILLTRLENGDTSY